MPCPHFVVVFTDGYAPWPDAVPPRVESVVVAVSDSTQADHIPDWASAISLGDP